MNIARYDGNVVRLMTTTLQNHIELSEEEGHRACYENFLQIDVQADEEDQQIIEDEPEKLFEALKDYTSGYEPELERMYINRKGSLIVEYNSGVKE